MGHGFSFALQLERLQSFDLDRLTDERQGRLAEQHVALAAVCSRRAATLTALHPAA